MKRLHALSIVVCILLSPGPVALAAEDEEGPTPPPAPQEASGQQDVELSLGGRLQWDFSVPLEDRPFEGRFGELSSDFEVRRGRLHVTGALYQQVGFKFELDFAGGEVVAKDIYMSVEDVAVDNRFGHFKEPFGLEELTSSRHMTFMERSLVNTLVPSRNTGVMIGDGFAGDAGTWAAGVFRDTDGFEATEGDNYNVTGRITYAPILTEDSSRLVHLGLSATHREMETDFRASARSGDHLSPTMLSVSVPADSADVFALEAAANFGPLGLQGEYTSASVGAVDGSDPRLHGFYVQGSYFLTGEIRPYSGGVFQRLRPRESFPDGSGAWEIAGRYSRLDVSEVLVAADATGEIWSLTVGVNWYWNPRLRWLLNYELADLSGVPGDSASSAHLRVAFDF